MQHLQKTRGTSFKPKAFLFLFPGALFNSSRCLRASVAAAPPPIFRTLFQVPYPAIPLFATLTKTPGVGGILPVSERGDARRLRQYAVRESSQCVGMVGVSEKLLV